MSYKYHTSISSPNNSGKRPRKPVSITLHWWGDPDHFSDGIDDGDAEGIAKYLSRPNGSSSAHYVVTGGHVWCIVDPDSVAWHAGNWTGNLTSIGIEVDADLQGATYETLAELVAQLWRVYGKIPLKRHRDWKATACPGPLDVDRVARRANEILKGGKPVSNPIKTPAPTKPTPRPKPKPKPVKPNIKALQRAVRAEDDNVWGPDTDKRLNAVREASRYGGSDFPYGVEYAQRVVGANDDGVWGPRSAAAHDETVEDIQRALGVTADGVWGPKTDAKFKTVRAKARA